MHNLIQHPTPSTHSIYYRGDTITFTLENKTQQSGKAWLRSNIGHAQIRHTEIIQQTESGHTPLSRDWHDLPMELLADGFTHSITLPLLEVGRFEAKTYFIPTDSAQISWPEGGNSILKVEPAETCAGNTMYTAFVRQFGIAKQNDTVAPQDRQAVDQLDQAGYAVIPPSGTFRDLIQELDFITGTLRCRILQLLPIHPTPTTYARMGRFGSPFAVMDLLDVDPSLAEFDQKTTPLDQFQELVDEVHKRNARIYLDLPINHTGWASHLQLTHPEWFHHNEEGAFVSPGAWGILWEDLSKLDYSHRDLWKYMAHVFLFWCHKGVDGFRCDAGYKVPFKVWEYIIAKVRIEYPDTIFMLEGLGGYKHITEHLLADSGMNWAYSEIFQNYTQEQINQYLPESIHMSETKGNLIHFSETHDNARLAATHPTYAKLRVGFCALTSFNGASGFTAGVEWFAQDQINVHNSHSLNWGTEPNQIDWIRQIHALLETHPVFHAGGTEKIITNSQTNSMAIQRNDASKEHPLLLLINLNHDTENTVQWQGNFADYTTDLLTGKSIHHSQNTYQLAPGEILCLTHQPQWIDRLSKTLTTEFPHVAKSKNQTIRAKAMDLFNHFSALDQLNIEAFLENPKELCETLAHHTPCVTSWQWPQDTRRTVIWSPDHFLLIQSNHPFIAKLKNTKNETITHEESIQQTNKKNFILFPPLKTPDTHKNLTLEITHFTDDSIQHSESPIMQLSKESNAQIITHAKAGLTHNRDRYAICTNEHGALSQVRIGWADLRSKYDALLSANLNPLVPVDRHTFFTRCKAWIVYRDYSNELSLPCQKSFNANNNGSIVWTFDIPVGEGRLIPLSVTLQMHPEENTLVLDFHRDALLNNPEYLDSKYPVTLILRPDIEDRCNHEITKAFTGPEEQWPKAIQAHDTGFVFTPASDRTLALTLPSGRFFQETEWTYNVEHPVDQARGIDGSSDLFSPGYFKVDLLGDESAQLIAQTDSQKIESILAAFEKEQTNEETPDYLSILEAMRIAMKQFIVKRDAYQTVIAGYPWFLDWGRDTLICLRGIIAAGFHEESQNILLQFAHFEKGGTLPNMIRGNDDNNRETSDAPLWFFVACDELMKAQGSTQLLQETCGDRTLKEVLISLATGLIQGTNNGIQYDEPSGLLFSPSHFTWMDTNYPAGTPRQGYPIEIQSLWYYALNLLASIDSSSNWAQRATQVQQSIHDLFIIKADDFTYLADLLVADPKTNATSAIPDDALRSNQLFAITLGAVTDPALCKSIIESCEQLLIPGAIRSLADRPVQHPAPIVSNSTSLNDPHNPYWGHYTDDEDTRRKPAYHNGTAWTWPFPSYAEALVITYGDNATPTALNLLGSASDVINHGCLRQTPEVLDGNTPHTQRGCGAQAWGATELFRVLHKLKKK